MSVTSIIATIMKWSLCLLYCTFVLCGLLAKWFMFSLRFWSLKERAKPPKCLSDPGFPIIHKYVKVNGVKLHCVCTGDENKKLMLFLHGFPEFWYSWRHQMKYFMDNYWVVAVDLRGYGDSEKPANISDYDASVLTKDLKALPVALGRTKIDVLVGHDWGGVICWELVATHPDLVSKYISVNIPHGGGYMKAAKSGIKQLKMSWYIFMFQMPYVAELVFRCQDLKVLDVLIQGANKEWTEVTDQDMEAFKYTFSQKGALTPPLNYYRALNLTGIGEKEFKKVEVPTLMIWGNNDLALCEEAAIHTADFVKDYTLKIVEGAPHFITNTHPQKVNHLMQEWLKLRE